MAIAQFLRGPGWLGLDCSIFAWGTLPIRYLFNSKSYWNLDFLASRSKYPIFAQTTKRLNEMHWWSKQGNKTRLKTHYRCNQRNRLSQHTNTLHQLNDSMTLALALPL